MKNALQRLADLESKIHGVLKAKVYLADGTTAIKDWACIFLDLIKQEATGKSENEIVRLVWLSDPAKYDNGLAGRYLVEVAKELNGGTNANEKSG